MKTKKIIVLEDGQQFEVGDQVNIDFKSGMGVGGATISKITDTGFQYQDGKKSAQYFNVERLTLCKKRDDI